MNETHKRYPRSIAEAFPNSKEGREARNLYACAIEGPPKEKIDTDIVVTYACAFALGFVTALLILT